MADWVTISSMATAGGTLVLAMATFSAVRSSNRSARVAERALMEGLRPLIVPSRLDDPIQKVGFMDGQVLRVDGGRGVAEVTAEAVYLAISVRNVGAGIAVLHGWRFSLQPEPGTGPPPPLEEFHRLTRDLYVPSGDVGFWQGVFRDPKAEEFRRAADAVAAGERLVIDILYGDHEGGQRAVSRLSMTTASDGGWMVSAARHWNIDRDDPR
ncbi:MAG TPA: hypothetical protein VH459_11395 [Gaiellales bacterium]